MKDCSSGWIPLVFVGESSRATTAFCVTSRRCRCIARDRRRETRCKASSPARQSAPSGRGTKRTCERGCSCSKRARSPGSGVSPCVCAIQQSKTNIEGSANRPGKEKAGRECFPTRGWSELELGNNAHRQTFTRRQRDASARLFA